MNNPLHSTFALLNIIMYWHYSVLQIYCTSHFTVWHILWELNILMSIIWYCSSRSTALNIVEYCTHYCTVQHILIFCTFHCTKCSTVRDTPLFYQVDISTGCVFGSRIEFVFFFFFSVHGPVLELTQIIFWFWVQFRNWLIFSAGSGSGHK